MVVMTTLVDEPIVFDVQVLDLVQLGELAVVVGRAVALELLLGLLAEIRAIHQEQHAPRAAELDQAVDRGDREQRLAGAGGHLDERAGTVVEQALLEVDDGAQLVRPQAGNSTGGIARSRALNVEGLVSPSLT